MLSNSPFSCDISLSMETFLRERFLYFTKQQQSSQYSVIVGDGDQRKIAPRSGLQNIQKDLGKYVNAGTAPSPRAEGSKTGGQVGF